MTQRRRCGATRSAERAHAGNAGCSWRVQQVLRADVLLLLLPLQHPPPHATHQVFCNLLTVLMTRHTAALLPFWQAALPRAGEAGRLLAAQVVALSAPGSGGDARLKGYVSLLLGLVSATLQVRGLCACVHAHALAAPA